MASSNGPALEGLKAAADTVKQLISLATLLLGFTLTFAKEFKPEKADFQVPGSLVLSWGLMIVCVVSGLWALMAITGSTAAAELSGGVGDPNGKNIKYPSVVCVVSFAIAIIALSSAGWTIVSR